MKARKAISALMILGILASGIPSRAVENYAISDIDSHWAEDEMSVLINADILKGSHTKANPDTNITRGEFTALISRTLSLESDGGEVFSDIPKSHMFYIEVDAASDAGIVNGIGGNMFMPDRSITREEIVLIIARTMDEKSASKITFDDIGKNYPYSQELSIAVSGGIISGYSDNTFRPKENATRAECGAMLARLLRYMEDIDKNELIRLSETYIQNDMEDIQNNEKLTTGRAKSELELKKWAQNKARENNTQTEKIPSGFELSSYNIDGSLANAVYEGQITYVTTTLDGTRQRTYDATYSLDLIEKNGNVYIYDSTLSLSKQQRINLTWEVYSAPPDYAPEGVNVVSPSSFQISAENLGVESKELMTGARFYNSLTRKYMDYAHQNGYEVWPIYKTDFTLKTSNSFLNSYEARQKSLEYLIDYACKYLIDGINIDFENIYERNRHLLTKHARELSTALHELGLIVSADITRLEPTSSNWSMCYNRDSLSDNTDYIMLMAYDEYYASSPKAGSVASLDWTEESIKRTLTEVPNNKLVLGIPFYMRYFEVSGTKVTSSKAISMQTAYDLINSNNVTYTYMESDRQYKISWQKDGKTCVFWLENTDTIAERAALCNKYSLAGIASWRRGLEISKVWSVIKDNLQ
ncbi:MAG: S-layer homology domain-containing protein [Clostridia bacterium]|nr:S-layer homology domain-containing protein [Clostridia bacterium]